MALIIHTLRRLAIEVVIESGRARGQSTYLLAKYLPDTQIHSVELRGELLDEAVARERVALYSHVTLHAGDGSILVPELAKAASPKRTAILCDGPKGATAVAILERCFEDPHVIVGFIHDMRKLDHGGPSPHRQVAIDRLPNHKFSDDPVLVAGSSWMDEEIIKAGGPAGPAHEKEFGSYGPTVGIFFNKQQAHQHLAKE